MAPTTQCLSTTRLRDSTTVLLRGGTKSFSQLPSLLSFLSPLEVSFPSRHLDYVWLDYLRGSSKTDWIVKVLVVFRDFAMPRGLLQVSPCLNHLRYLLADSRRHGDRRYRPLYHHRRPGAAASAATLAAAVAADVADYRQGQHRLYLLIAFYLVNQLTMLERKMTSSPVRNCPGGFHRGNDYRSFFFLFFCATFSSFSVEILRR